MFDSNSLIGIPWQLAKSRLQAAHIPFKVMIGASFNRFFEIADEGQMCIRDSHNAMVRPAVANIDQVVLVVAAHEPDINELLLNKMLVMIEHADIPIVLCINTVSYTHLDVYKRQPL